MKKRKDTINKKKIYPPIGLLWKTEFEYKTSYSLQDVINRLEKVRGRSEVDFGIKVAKNIDSSDIVHFRLSTKTPRVQGLISGIVEKLNDDSVIVRGYAGIDGFPIMIVFVGFPVFSFLTGILFSSIGLQLFLVIYVLLLVLFYVYGKNLKSQLTEKIMAVINS